MGKVLYFFGVSRFWGIRIFGLTRFWVRLRIYIDEVPCRFFSIMRFISIKLLIALGTVFLSSPVFSQMYLVDGSQRFVSPL